MRRKLLFATLLLLSAEPAFADTLTNRSIIVLSASGIGDEAIIAKIQASDTKFDLSTDQMLALKKKGVSGPVIAAMIAADNRSKPQASATVREPVAPRGRPSSANLAAQFRPAGIYLATGGQLVRLDFNVSGQTKTGGFLGSAFTYGIAKISTRVVLQGETARVRSDSQTPTFYFYLPAGASRATASSFDQPASSSPSSPNEFSLVHLSKKSGSREARIGRGNISGFQSGVADKDRINFTFDEVRPGVFAVKTGKPLESGEYCFVMIGSGGAATDKFFDFSVP